MNLREREDLHLLLLRDAAIRQHMWLDRWEVSYPQVLTAQFAAANGLPEQSRQLQAAIDGAPAESPLFVVAHGAACAAFCAWLFDSSVLQQKRIKGVMLVAPLFVQWQNDAEHTLQRARASFPTAVVVGTDDAACTLEQAQHIAAELGGKALQSPHKGHLDSDLFGWQWGMKLMQEMILA